MRISMIKTLCIAMANSLILGQSTAFSSPTQAPNDNIVPAVAGISTAEIEQFADTYFKDPVRAANSPGAMVEIVDAAGNRWEKGYGVMGGGDSRVPNPQRAYF
jgi:CubicO group peptidase (beta-lactamase class C family)